MVNCFRMPSLFRRRPHTLLPTGLTTSQPVSIVNTLDFLDLPAFSDECIG